MREKKKTITPQENREHLPTKVIRLIFSVTLFIFLGFSLLANSIFQLDFFSKRWLLENQIGYLLLFVENGGKVLIEIIAFTIFTSSKGAMKYLTTSIIWVLLLYLLSYSIFQTFNSRTYLTQYEAEKLKIERYKNENIHIKKQIKFLESLIKIENKSIGTDQILQGKKEAIILDSLKKTKNQWLIAKNLKTLTQKFDYKSAVYERLNHLQNRINNLNNKLQTVDKTTFTYTQSLDNVFEGKVKIWDIIADLVISIGREGLIFTLVIGLFFIWKNEAVFVAKSINIPVKTMKGLDAISGDKLREIRIENEAIRGLSYSQFAKLVGLTDNELDKYEALGEILIPGSVVDKLNDMKALDIIY